MIFELKYNFFHSRKCFSKCRQRNGGHFVHVDKRATECGGAQPLYTFGLLVFALSLVDFLSLLLSPRTDIKIFFSKVSFEGRIQNLQKIHVGLNFKWVCRTNIEEVVNVFHLTSSLVAFVMASWELLMQTCWWPLSDHWSVQLTSPHLCGFVWYGGLKA